MSSPDLDYMMRSLQYDDYRQTAELDRQANHFSPDEEKAEVQPHNPFEALLRRLTGQRRHSPGARSH
jgi:hypothetical protein